MSQLFACFSSIAFIEGFSYLWQSIFIFEMELFWKGIPLYRVLFASQRIAVQQD